MVTTSILKTVDFKINGMTCTACEAHINYEVNKVNGVFSTIVSYQNGNAIIQFETTKTHEKELLKDINTSRYNVNSSELPNFRDHLIFC